MMNMLPRRNSLYTFRWIDSLEEIRYYSKKYYKKKEHWAEARRKNKPVDKALSHFDEFYSAVYGDRRWRSIRIALLCPIKYCAVINNFGDAESTKRILEDRGAINLKNFLQLGKERIAELKMEMAEKNESTTVTSESTQSIDKRMQLLSSSNSPYTSFYYEGREGDQEYQLQLETYQEARVKEENMSEKYVEKLSLEESLAEAEIDHDRIIESNDPTSMSALHEFIPASKLHGLDDWIPESEYFNFYKKNMDFPITVEEENVPLSIPETLDIYLYEKCNTTLFPVPEKASTDVLNYYILNGASVLPVIALDLKSGDRLLDLCASPGGKSMTAIQSLCLDHITCNDVDFMRICRLHKVINEYLYNTDYLENVEITRQNALSFADQEIYNKILVDVPCTNDRESLKDNTYNIFHPLRLKERLKMPEVQSQLLIRALKLIPEGGTVVYSTCTLSPIQNDGVVQMALKRLWDESENEYAVKNVRNIFKAFEVAYHLDSSAVEMKYGVQVIPNLTANFGPLYFSKIVRTR